jgi:hypothetical protein
VGGGGGGQCSIKNVMQLSLEAHVHKTTYGPLIDTALYVMRLVRANALFGQVGVGWALEISTLGHKWQALA